MKKSLREVSKLFENHESVENIVAEMQKTVLMDSEGTIRRVLSGLVQSLDDGLTLYEYAFMYYYITFLFSFVFNLR